MVAGSEEFRIGGVIRQTFRIAGLKFWGFFLVALVVVALPNWLGPILEAPSIAALNKSAAAGQVPGTLVFVQGFALGAAPGIVSLLGTVVLTGMMVQAALDGFSGRRVGFGSCLRTGLVLFPANLALKILAYLGIALGLLLLVVPGLILSYAWLIVVPVHVAERGPLMAAFGRSRHLTAGYRWRIVGLTLVYGLIAGLALGFMSGLAFGLARQGVGGEVITALRLVSSALSAALSVISSAGVAAIYLALRRAKEGVLSADLVDAFA